METSSTVKRINALLAEKGISKKDFYRDCGISSASYSLWNTGKNQPRMKNLEIIARYLGTSVEYLLTGLGEKEVAQDPAERGAFWENFVALCQREGKAPNTVAAEIGIKSSATVTGWKGGSIPQRPILQKLADYFGVEVEDLLNAKKPATLAGSGLSETGYDLLTEKNKAIVDALIASLLESQSDA